MKSEILLVFVSYCLISSLALSNIQPLPSPILLENENLVIDLSNYYTGVNISFTSSEINIPSKIQLGNSQSFNIPGSIIDFGVQQDSLNNWILPGPVAILSSNNTVYWSNINNPQQAPTFTSANSYYINSPNLTCFSLDIYNSSTIVIDCQDTQSDYFVFLTFGANPTVVNSSAAHSATQLTPSRKIIAQTINLSNQPFSGIIRYTTNCTQNCYVQVNDATKVTQIKVLHIYNSGVPNLKNLKIQDVAFLNNYLYVLDPNGLFYQFTVPNGGGKANITVQSLYQNGSAEQFFSFDFHYHPFDASQSASIYVLTNQSIYQYYIDTDDNIGFTQAHPLANYIDNIVGGLVTSANNLAFAKVTGSDGSQITLGITHRDTAFPSQLYLVLPIDPSIGLCTVSPKDNSIFLFAPSGVYPAQVFKPKITVSASIFGNYSFSINAADIEESDNFEIQIQVIESDDENIYVTNNPAIQTNYTTQAGSTAVTGLQDVFSGPFISWKPVNQSTSQYLSLKNNLPLQPTLFNFLVSYSIGTYPFVLVTQMQNHVVYLQKCSLSLSTLQCNTFNDITNLKTQIINVTIGSSFFGFSTQDQPNTFQTWFYNGSQADSFLFSCNQLALIADPNFPYTLCAENKTLNLISTSFNSPIEYAFSSQITNILTSPSFSWIIFVQTGAQMNLVYLQSFLNGTSPILTTFSVDPNSYPVVSGNSLIMVGDTISEYDLSDIYNIVKIKDYGDYMTMNDLSEIPTYLASNLGLFYMVGNLTNMQGNMLNITALDTGRAGNNNWVTSFGACPYGSTINAITSSSNDQNSEIIFIHCVTSNVDIKLAYLITLNPSTSYTNPNILGTTADVVGNDIIITATSLLNNNTQVGNININLIDNEPKINVTNEVAIQINATEMTTYTYQLITSDYFDGVFYGLNIVPENPQDASNFVVNPRINQNVGINISIDNPLTDAYNIPGSDVNYFLIPQTLYAYNNSKLISIALTDVNYKQLACQRVIVLPGEQNAVIGCNHSIYNGVFLYVLNIPNETTTLIGQYYSNNIKQLRLLDNQTVALLTDNFQLYIVPLSGNQSYLMNSDNLPGGFFLPIDFDATCADGSCSLLILDQSGMIKVLTFDLTTYNLINPNYAFDLTTMDQLLQDGLTGSVIWQALSIYNCTDTGNCNFLVSSQFLMTYLFNLNMTTATLNAVLGFHNYEETQPSGIIDVSLDQGLFMFMSYTYSDQGFTLALYEMPENISSYKKVGPIGATGLTYKHPYIKPYMLVGNKVWRTFMSYIYQYNILTHPSIFMNFTGVTSTYAMLDVFNEYSQGAARFDFILPNPGPGPGPNPGPTPGGDTWILIVIGVAAVIAIVIGVWYVRTHKRKRELEANLTGGISFQEGAKTAQV